MAGNGGGGRLVYNIVNKYKNVPSLGMGHHCAHLHPHHHHSLLAHHTGLTLLLVGSYCHILPYHARVSGDSRGMGC